MNALSFFQPAYLWALGFLSVILALHFFRRRVTKRIDVSTLRFLPAAAVRSSRVRKLADLLLLLARLLIVAALILAFAGPYDRGSPLVALRDPRASVYIWIDPTMSMEYAEGGETVGQRAFAVADSLTATLPSSELYLFDGETGRFQRAGDIERPVFAGRFGPPELGEAVDAFLAAPSSESSSGVFIIISDFQRGTTEQFDSLSEKLRGGGTVICVAVTPEKPYNYAVAMRADGTALVRAYGAALDTTFAELTAGSLRVGQRSVFCGRDDSAAVAFDLPSGPVAAAHGRVELHAPDPLPFDNKDYFTVTADRGRAVLIAGDAGRNRVIAAALRAAAPAFWDPVVIKEGGELSYDDLNSADLVIVNALAGRSRTLESFIAGAGADKGVIIALDPEREDDFGRAFLQSSGMAHGGKLAVITIEKGAHPVLPDTNTALWRGFPTLSSANARVYRHTPLIGNALVRLSNGRALVTSSGSITFIATPIGITRANNICETGFFVPFIDRLARHALSGRGEGEEARYAGYPSRNPFFGTGRSGTLYDADGRIAANWQDQPFVKVDRPGVYSLISPSGETVPIAVSAHPSEGEAVYARPETADGGGIYYFEYKRFLEQFGGPSAGAWPRRLWVALGLLLCAEAFLWKQGNVTRRAASR